MIMLSKLLKKILPEKYHFGTHVALNGHLVDSV